MMMSEFIERTGYTPDYDEYKMIEESYYEFPGNKDEFCKQWLKDKEDGHWQRELNLMKAMDEMKAKYEKKIAEQEDDLAFYRKKFDELIEKDKALKLAQNQLQRIKRIMDSTTVVELI